MKYIKNYIVKPFRASILHYSKRVCEMHDLTNFLPPSSNKGDMFYHVDWSVYNKYFTKDKSSVETKDGISISMMYGMDNKDKEYFSLPH